MTIRIMMAAALLVLGHGVAAARPATCETTDEGRYACDFRPTDGKGSFRISARGKPTYVIEVDEPGIASVFADFGTGRNVSLPGPYRLSKGDRACWIGDGTGARICAR
ncbi:hypothetical protein [uncultured Enterovirga sp.]|uniref:hypothetical protein n=1 Tax=uncultured Enterovirga sp. TaxID=2026352 RepID=UPI0035CB5357